MICIEEKCSGCMACYNICPVNAIKMYKDTEGFKRPKIEENKCIHCDKCKHVCPENKKVKRENRIEKQIVYGCWNKNKHIRKNSTSGGLFTALAETIIKNNGVAYGAAFDDKFDVKHMSTSNIDELHKFRGSKYIQSSIQKSYAQAKKDLDNKLNVLFTGTPCQIAGLYSYLGKEYNNLYTCDVVCHGVPSPALFEEYIKKKESEYHSKAEKIYFRNKFPGWHVFSMKIVFNNRKRYCKNTYEDPWIRGFLREYMLRPACHQCRYANMNRISDITMADFWGYINTSYVYRNNDKGISMCMINTINGKKLFEKAKEKLEYIEKPIDMAVRGNPCLSKCFSPSDKRDKFWEDYKQFGYQYIEKKYFYPDTLSNKNKLLYRFKIFALCKRMKDYIKWNIKRLIKRA